MISLFMEGTLHERGYTARLLVTSLTALPGYRYVVFIGARNQGLCGACIPDGDGRIQPSRYPRYLEHEKAHNRSLVPTDAFGEFPRR